MLNWSNNASLEWCMPASVATIVPTLNQGPFLKDTICSLMNQTGINLQVALLDGGIYDWD
jgi:hypothetical protein